MDRRNPLLLSVFGLPGRHGGGEMPIFYPSEQVLKAAHVHVLINCTEVTPYLDQFLMAHSSIFGGDFYCMNMFI
jgi:hypothetical protein